LLINAFSIDDLSLNQVIVNTWRAWNKAVLWGNLNRRHCWHQEMVKGKIWRGGVGGRFHISLIEPDIAFTHPVLGIHSISTKRMQRKSNCQ